MSPLLTLLTGTVGLSESLYCAGAIHNSVGREHHLCAMPHVQRCPFLASLSARLASSAQCVVPAAADLSRRVCGSLSFEDDSTTILRCYELFHGRAAIPLGIPFPLVLTQSRLHVSFQAGSFLQHQSLLLVYEYSTLHPFLVCSVSTGGHRSTTQRCL